MSVIKQTSWDQFLRMMYPVSPVQDEQKSSEDSDIRELLVDLSQGVANMKTPKNRVDRVMILVDNLGIDVVKTTECVRFLQEKQRRISAINPRETLEITERAILTAMRKIVSKQEEES